MLRDEHRVITPWRLTAIVARIRGREPFGDESGRLLHDMRQTPRLQVRELFPPKPEPAAKRRSGQFVKGRFDVDHGVATTKRPIC